VGRPGVQKKNKKEKEEQEQVGEVYRSSTLGSEAMKSSVLGIRDFKPSGCLYWALANKLVIVLTLTIPVLLLVVFFRPFR
jgi:hypothetical protein